MLPEVWAQVRRPKKAVKPNPAIQVFGLRCCEQGYIDVVCIQDYESVGSLGFVDYSPGYLGLIFLCAKAVIMLWGTGYWLTGPKPKEIKV